MPKAKKTKVSRVTKSRKMEAGESTAAEPVEIPGSDTTVYFWRPHDPNGFMSQWYTSPFTHEEITYHTAEMWMMVQKAKLFKDEETAAKMLQTTDPKKHKGLGRKVKDFDKDVWDREKERIVEEGSWLKFTQSENVEDLRALLLVTGEKELVEASPLDRIWGVGYAPRNAEAKRDSWGQNLLGKALMKVRSRLQEKKSES